MARRPQRQGRPTGSLIIDVIEIAYYDGYECRVANAYARRFRPRLTQKASGLNVKVPEFSRAQMGHVVGVGECPSLVTRAHAKAGAGSVSRHFPNPGDYVWGTLPASVSAHPAGVKGIDTLYWARGGDIIQMRNLFLQGRNSSGGSYWMQADHHTAVLESVNPGLHRRPPLELEWQRREAGCFRLRSHQARMDEDALARATPVKSWQGSLQNHGRFRLKPS